MQRSDEHESAFIDAFVIRERRSRYRSKLASSKRRSAFLDRLNHRFLDDLDRRFICPSRTTSLPAPTDTCYVIASETEYDATHITVGDIHETLANAFFGILISIVPGKLAAYKDEVPSDVVWLVRE